MATFREKIEEKPDKDSSKPQMSVQEQEDPEDKSFLSGFKSAGGGHR
jgi:hypothetical protein